MTIEVVVQIVGGLDGLTRPWGAYVEDRYVVSART